MDILGEHFRGLRSRSLDPRWRSWRPQADVAASWPSPILGLYGFMLRPRRSRDLHHVLGIFNLSAGEDILVWSSTARTSRHELRSLEITRGSRKLYCSTPRSLFQETTVHPDSQIPISGFPPFTSGPSRISRSLLIEGSRHPARGRRDGALPKTRIVVAGDCCRLRV